MDYVKPIFDVAITGYWIDSAYRHRVGVSSTFLLLPSLKGDNNRSELPLARALAHSGCIFIHLVANSYYGRCHTRFRSQELLDGIKVQPTSESASIYSTISYRFPSSNDPDPSPFLRATSRQCAISLVPSLVPSSGALILDALVGLGVSRLLNALSAVECGGDANPTLLFVPSSEEDIFKNQSLSLLAKRKLMKCFNTLLTVPTFQATSLRTAP